MPRDPLDREWGVLLAVGGAELMSKAMYYRRMADLIERELGEHSRSAAYLRSQADRAEETIVNLARKLDQQK